MLKGVLRSFEGFKGEGRGWEVVGGVGWVSRGCKEVSRGGDGRKGG